MREFQFALKRTVPILFTYLFIGVAFGVMMAEAGYSAIWSLLSSLLIYAGSMQIVMVSLLKSGTPPAAVAVMTLLVNARHLFYGVGMLERFRGMGRRFPYMVFSLTDETYSVLCSTEYPPELDGKRADFFIALANQAYWVAGTALGALAGRLLPFDLRGIDFSATAFFLVVVLNQWRQCASRLPACLGLGSALAFYVLLGPDRFLLPALAVSVAGLTLLKMPILRKEAASHVR